jgi:hypothetical protein
MPVDLPAEIDLRIVEIINADVCPSEAAQLRDPSTGKRGHGKQRSERLVCGGDGLLKLLARENRSAIGL